MRTISLFLFLIIANQLFAGQHPEYHSLDSNDPIAFDGKHIIYQNQQITLGPTAFFIDGQLSDAEAAQYDFVFNSINEAAKELTNGTEQNPMTLYIAPWVYWIDNPDDPEVRVPKENDSAPFGLEIECQWLKFQGLNQHAGNVILASNRGQTMGAKGNFTMFKIMGDGLSSENITFGNYCNIDLVFPLNPTLNRDKRGSAIVQAQLAWVEGDKIVARNTRFISRLNLLPFCGGERTLFDSCHFECTDDALAGRGIYLNCTFGFYSSKPFAITEKTGAVFLNCDITSYTRGEQYFVKWFGQMAVIDCRMQATNVDYWGWRQDLETASLYYDYNNQLNGKGTLIGSKDPFFTIDLTNKAALKAYRFEYQNQVIYNTYNLLKGTDDWDPMNIKEMVLSAEKEMGELLTQLPTQLTLSVTQSALETGKDSALLTAKVYTFDALENNSQSITWSVAGNNKNLITLQVNDDHTCTVIPTNSNDETADVIVVAETGSGLKAASKLSIAPAYIAPPEFKSNPVISKAKNQLIVDYKLDMKYEDQSLISWYRCSNAAGDNAIKVAVSRFNEPLKTYALSTADVGYYLMATVEPKHLRCNAGAAISYIYPEPINNEDVIYTNKYVVDLASLPTDYQDKVIPGFWTVDCFKPLDTDEYKEWAADTLKNSWYYGSGINGAANDTGLIQATKGARLRYTPVASKFTDMKVSFTVCPAKTAGQGFSSARAQYMDICIKFDTKNLTGFALRLIRTTKYGDAIDCMFMKYENGVATPIGEPVSTSCYRSPCSVSLEITGKKLTAHMQTSISYFEQVERPEVKPVVDMEISVEPNAFGGFGIQHTGTVGSGASLIKDLKLEWGE